MYISAKNAENKEGNVNVVFRRQEKYENTFVANILDANTDQ